MIVDHLAQQLFLGTEVPVQQAVIDLGTLRNLADRNGVGPLLAKQFVRGCQDRDPHLFPALRGKLAVFVIGGGNWRQCDLVTLGAGDPRTITSMGRSRERLFKA